MFCSPSCLDVMMKVMGGFILNIMIMMKTMMIDDDHDYDDDDEDGDDYAL